MNTTKQNSLKSTFEMTVVVDGVEYKVLGGSTSCGKEVLIMSELLKPAWDSSAPENALSKFPGKEAKGKNLASENVFYMKGRKGPESVAIEACVFLDFMKKIKNNYVDKEKFKQVEETLIKYIEGNRDMIGSYPTSPARANNNRVEMAAGRPSNGATTGAVGVPSKDAQAMEIETDPMELLPCAMKDRFVPYKCSSFCEEKAFYVKGGCPTCNTYWQPLGFRDSKVKTMKSRGVDVVVKSVEIEPLVLAKHYSEVQKNNPTWKLEDGIPVPPSALEVASLDKKTAMKRGREKEKEIEYENDLKDFPRAPPLSKTVLHPTFQCSDVCLTGKFRGTKGCPTCNQFWDAIGLRNPERGTTDRIKEGFLQDEMGKPYHTYFWDKNYDIDDIRKHFDEMLRRFPLWPRNKNNEPMVPTELLTHNKKGALMLTKEPYHSQYVGDYSSKFSWPQPAVCSFLAKNVLAYWSAVDAWLPAQIIGSCSVRMRYKIRFYDFGVLSGPAMWKPRTFIKLVVWAPSHSTETKRDPSLVGRNVMARGHGNGWKPGRIADPEDTTAASSGLDVLDELAKDYSKYYVVFHGADRKADDSLSTDPALHKSLFPYQFCLILDETLPTTTGIPLVYTEPDTVTLSDIVNSWVVALDAWVLPEEQHRWRPGRITHLFEDTLDILVVFEGECETVSVARDDYNPVKRPPVLSVGEGFDSKLVEWAAFAPRKMKDTGLEAFHGCYVSGFSGTKYLVRFNDIECDSNKNSNEGMVCSSKLWLYYAPWFPNDAADVGGVMVDDGQAGMADTGDAIVVDKLWNVAERVDLNQI